MARLAIDGEDLVISLSPLERLGALMLAEPRVPLSQVRFVRVSHKPFRELRGIRSPGTGVPGMIALGTRRHRGGRDFVAIFGKRPAVVVELGPCGRFVVSMPDAEKLAAQLLERIGDQ